MLTVVFFFVAIAFIALSGAFSETDFDENNKKTWKLLELQTTSFIILLDFSNYNNCTA
jgi:hypothetical protein